MTVIERASAQEIIDHAKQVFCVTSLYALAQVLELDPKNVQRYYRDNHMPHYARRIFMEALSNVH